MTIALFELTTCRQRFEYFVYKELNNHNGRSLSSNDSMNIDVLYTTMISAISDGLIASLKDKKLTASVLDSVNTVNYMTALTDNVIYLLHSLFGFNLSFEEVSSFCSIMDTSLINDITQNVPDIDSENIIVFDYQLCPTNSISLEYKVSNESYSLY